MDVRIFLYISACFVLAVYVSAVIKIRLNTASWIKGILIGLAVLPFSVYVYGCVFKDFCVHPEEKRAGIKFLMYAIKIAFVILKVYPLIHTTSVAMVCHTAQHSASLNDDVSFYKKETHAKVQGILAAT